MRDRVCRAAVGDPGSGREVEVQRNVFAIAVAGMLACAAHAAAPVRLTVDRTGRIVLSAGSLNRLGVKQATRRTVWVQFPARVHPSPPKPPPGSRIHALPGTVPDPPVRFLLPLRPDGGL